MSELVKRIISGILYVAVLGFGIWYHPVSFVLLFFILMLGSLYEFTKLIDLQSIFPYLISVLLFVFANIWNTDGFQMVKWPYYTGILLFLSFFTAFISILFSSKKEAVPQLGKIFLSVMYIGVPFTLIVLIPFINRDFQYIHTTILGIFILVWVNDTFAYITGTLAGKHKLLERISPKKTVEGFIGGVLFTLAGAGILHRFFTALTLTNWLIIAAIIGVFGVLGDLIESMFKRQAGVKDSSRLIPGHGGLLDRLDSVIFAAPFIFLYLISVWD